MADSDIEYQTMPPDKTTRPPLAPGHTPPPDSHLSEEEQVAIVSRIRSEIVDRARPTFDASPSPIRAMARLVKEVQDQALKAGVSPQVLEREVVNATIGDVNVRHITEKVNGIDFSTIGEDLGLILPGEEIAGRISTGRVYRELHRRQEEIERRLLTEYKWDIRNYDVYGTGNPLLREMLASRFERLWGIPTDPARTLISIGALDALYKIILTLGHHFKRKYGSAPTFAFPAPGFAVVNWQVQTSGLKLLLVNTTEQHRFKVTPDQLRAMLAEDPQLRLLYFTVSNNPTAFSYTPEEIREIYQVIEEDGREFAVLADLAYIGTGPEEADRARMQAFNRPQALERTLFVNSLSKVFTLTGDRCGWVSLQNLEWAELLKIAWNNITAGLPAEWQLRFAAYIQWFDEHPEIQQKIRALYDLRRERFRQYLHRLNARHDVFVEIGLDDHTTIYNWSKLRPGEDALSLFKKTGLAGVSGKAFGYTDNYIRFSVGFFPVEDERGQE
jgi:aspartate/methionine/tyrosine aminotransferase